MSVASTTRKQQFTLDGATADFTFTFRALTSAPSNIKCLSTTGGTDTILTYTTQYSVAVNSNGVGGTVTLVDPAAVGSGTLTVYRETTNKQESDYDDYNQFPADTVETDLDIRTMVSQEHSEDTDRALTLPISVSGVSAELPSPDANTLIGWNSAADGLENKTLAALDALEKCTPAEAITGSDYTKYMTPTTTTVAIKSYFDTDGTLAANSDSKIATQKAVKTYAGYGDIIYIIDGGGDVITSGSKTTIAIDVACSITKATIVADQVGSIVVDIHKATAPTYPTTTVSTTSICASAQVTLSSKLAAQDTTLTGWTKAIAAGDLLRFDVTSAATITSVAIILKYIRT